ncbi:MAG: ribonuclease HII [Flavobacteriales bacterium]|jgi:ribonuclease HII
MKPRLLAALSQHPLEAGCDEAGRGCLAGPVVAAAVILPAGFHHPLLNDSKKLNHRQRELLRPVIETSAVAWAVGLVSPAEIDEINILRASFLAMHRALSQLMPQPGFIAVDGNRFVSYGNVEHSCIVQGDSQYAHIAAASVLAKTHRDAMMETLHGEFPHYNWNRNKGYPTSEHRLAIRKHGASSHHRKSFTLLPAQQNLEFPE